MYPATLQVNGFDNVWSAGDNAQVPDLAVGEGAWCQRNAQHACRQATVLGDNIIARLRGRRQKEYKHKNLRRRYWHGAAPLRPHGHQAAGPVLRQALFRRRP